MRQNVSVVVMFVAMFMLGMWGQYTLHPDTFWRQVADLGYEVLTLFVLEGEWTYGQDLPLQLQISRYLSPLVLVAGIVIVATQDAWVRVLNSVLRFRQDHIIVAGLGEKSWQFIESCRGQKFQIAVIEINPDNPLINRARSQNVNVVVGDALDLEVLKQVNLRSARHLVTFTGEDGTNVELAIKARDYIRGFNDLDHRLQIHLHLDDTLVSERLETYDKFFLDSNQAEISFFSVFDSTARLLLAEYPPEIYAEVFGQRNIHVALYELKSGHDLGRHILLEVTRICQFANGSRLYFSIFTGEADKRKKDLLDNYPSLNELCHNIEFIENQGTSLNLLNNITDRLLQHITYHVVCGDTDGSNLLQAIALRNVLLLRRASNSPILVRMQQSSGLAQLLESERGSPEIPDGLYPFGMLEKVLHHENILGDRMDRLAQAIHERYLQEDNSGRLKQWRQATEAQRKDSKLTADHLVSKLRSIRCAPDATGLAEDFRYLGNETTLLGAMEHERWRVNKIYEGYKSGPERIAAARVNPFVKPWHELTADQQQGNIDFVSNYPAMLREDLQWGITRDFVIGITGHRLNKIDINNEALQQSIQRVLQKLVDDNPSARFTVLSPLAEGSDRLVARIAMEQFGMDLIVPLPLPYELYMEDFGTESLEEFKELIGKASRYYELPMRFGNLEDLGQRSSGETNELRNQQYALVGSYVCERADELIAIYDGEPAAGTGGTADIVNWRKLGEVPEEYQNDASFFQRPLMREPIVLEPNP